MKSTKQKTIFTQKSKKEKQSVKNLANTLLLFDYSEKTFIILPASFGTLSIVSHGTLVGISVGLAGASSTVAFSLTT